MSLAPVSRGTLSEQRSSGSRSVEWTLPYRWTFTPRAVFKTPIHHNRAGSEGELTQHEHDLNLVRFWFCYGTRLSKGLHLKTSGRETLFLLPLGHCPSHLSLSLSMSLYETYSKLARSFSLPFPGVRNSNDSFGLRWLTRIREHEWRNVGNDVVQGSTML